MGYMHIENLYRAPEILRCYALEKVHGTSAHVLLRGLEGHTHPDVHLAAGGVGHDQFARLFDVEALKAKFAEKFTGADALTIYGEAFGGKSQGMSATYGKELRFLAFDVKLNDVWLDVPAAAGLAAEFGLGFVPYEEGPLTLEFLDAQRDRDSLAAIEPGKRREGIVIRPIKELLYKDGGRFIFKHKREEFRETTTVREVDPEKAKVMAEADAVAEEYVTSMRLRHVLQRVPFDRPEDTRKVIDAMLEDVKRESSGEVVWSQAVEKAISRATAKLLHQVPNLSEAAK
jgi:hypothetical protein